MGAFSFMPDPTADAFTPDQFMEQAYDQPFAKTDAFVAAGTSAVLESADLGTNLRNLAVPEGRTNIIEKRAFGRSAAGMLLEPYARKPMNWLLGSFGRETDEQLQARGEQPLTAEQYKASPSYRERVPYDDAMTASRAAALASFDDAKSVREEMARKAPWWVNLSGTAAGGALSPTNYIPVFGEAAAGASIGSRVIRSGADAAANVGVAGLLSAPTRAQYGDDVSFQAQVSQIAMGAAIGGVFGAIGGAWAKRGEARDARTAAIRAGAEGRLATIRNGQDSMATLREAVTHLEQDGEINLGEASIDRLDALHDQAAATLPESEARVPVENTSPEAVALRSQIEDLRTKISDQADSIDSAQQLTDKVDELQKKLDALPTVIKSEELAAADGLDVTKAPPTERLYTFDEEMDAMSGHNAVLVSDKDGNALATLYVQREGNVLHVKDIHREGAGSGGANTLGPAKMRQILREYVAENPGITSIAGDRVTGARGAAGVSDTAMRIELPQRPTRTVLATKPKPETVQPEATKAAAAVGKADTPKTMAETYGVDHETGAIPEDFELKQLEREGRMKPGSEDAKAMEVANENFETAKSWGEALRAAVACLI